MSQTPAPDIEWTEVLPSSPLKSRSGLSSFLAGAPYAWLLAIPLLFLCVFLVYPLLKLLVISFHNYDISTIVGDRLTLENYTKLVFDPFYQRALLRTMRIGATVSLICILIAYPTAYYLARSTSKSKGWLIFLLLAPLMVGLVVRTYGWIILLGDTGSVNELLMGLGLTHAPVRFLYTEWAVLIALVESLTPYMILPIISSLQKINPSLEEAASTLGAGPWEVMRRVVIPLSLPGVISGTIIVFSLAAGAIVTPAVLGGPEMQTMGTLIYQVMISTVNWPLGSALAFVILAFQVLPVFLVFAITGRKRVR